MIKPHFKGYIKLNSRSSLCISVVNFNFMEVNRFSDPSNE